MSTYAGVAQLVEQLICNQQVGGSSPSTSSIYALMFSANHVTDIMVTNALSVKASNKWVSMAKEYGMT